MQPRAAPAIELLRGAAPARDAGAAPREVTSERPWVTSVLLLPLLVLLAALALSSCGRPSRPPGTAATFGGDARRGQQALARYGCGSCHTMQGVRGAHGKVGPPLEGVGERTILAGQVPNTPENMARWIRDPQAIEPNTVMPNLGVDEITARDMVAYLYGQR